MDWKLVLTTFATIFLAEMGDKTQLAVITLSASSRKPIAIFVGGALALTSVTLIGVFIGEAVTRVLPESILNRIAAILFVAIGIWTWFKA